MRLLSLVTLLCLTSALSAEIPQSSLQVYPPLDQIYHPVSTKSPEAQKHFDTGLTYVFAYNHDLAFSEFEKAAQLDPQLAMAYWGMALSLGQNVNSDVTRENELRCYALMQKAQSLSASASESEKSYILALSARYTNDQSADLIPLRYSYRTAMRNLVTLYPEDLDAATLYAESILALNPWKWWRPDGTPFEGTYEAIDVLESVLNRNPLHIGANHFYIHAWEESPYPERALMSAHRLEKLLPESGHLLHMPCHIFVLTGDYESALKTSQNAILQDENYVQTKWKSGTYPLHYLSHNLYVLSRIYMFMENEAGAIKTAEKLIAFLKPHANEMPLEGFAVVPLQVYLYFHNWKEILRYEPFLTSASVNAFLHYARAMAFIHLDSPLEADKEKALMQTFKSQIPPGEQIAQNSAIKVIEIAELQLQSAALLHQNELSKSIAVLSNAAQLQDHLYYDEPPAWFLPLRQTLGRLYLQQEDYTAAEATFKKGLEQYKRNGRLLFGLALSLKGQGRLMDAYNVEREMRSALMHATKPLTLFDL